MSEFYCEFCRKDDMDQLYEGWFYTSAKNDPWAKGTASAGLMQLRKACKECVQKAMDAGMTKATSFPEDETE